MLEQTYPNPIKAGAQQQFLLHDKNVPRRVIVDPGQANLPLHPHPFREVYQSASGDYVAVGRLPTRNQFFNDGPVGATDPLHLAEFIRQGVEVISRALLDVPFEHTFILKKTKLTLDPLFERADDYAELDHFVVVPKSQVRRRGDGTAYAADGPFACMAEDQHIATYEGTVAFLQPEAYKSTRGGDDAPEYGDPQGWVEPLDPVCVGKRKIENVLIGAAARHEQGMTALLIPQARPPYFDRPLDHYPGMMMAEAARQLTVLMAYLNSDVLPDQVHVTSIEMDFKSFAELNTQPTLHAVATSKPAQWQDFKVTVKQADAVRASFAIQTRFVRQERGAR